MCAEEATIEELLQKILGLPSDWHGAGSLRPDVLRSIARRAAERELRFSAETGTGKSTLLLSHLSPNHTVFAKDDRGDGDSLVNVQQSPLLRRDVVTFVVGPTQRTLPLHQFAHPLQLVLLDGPHGYPFPELEYYFIYPHLSEDALLIVDDIQLPTVFNFFCFLREDEMFRHIETVHTTAFFVRTGAPVFNPLDDGWWLQNYNKKRYPVRDKAVGLSPFDRLKGRVPHPLKSALKRLRAKFR
jgi:hypothetical protein